MTAIVPVTAMPYAAPSELDERKPRTRQQAPHHEGRVDLREVDLSGLRPRGVDDRDARKVSEPDCLAGEREGSGDQRLGGDDRGEGREAEERVEERPWSQEVEGILDGLGLTENEGALAEVVEQQGREHEARATRGGSAGARSGPCRRRAPPRRSRRGRRRRARGTPPSGAPRRAASRTTDSGRGEYPGSAQISTAPSKAMVTNQTSMTGPNILPTPAVPRFWRANRSRSRTAAIGTTHGARRRRGDLEPLDGRQHGDRRCDHAVTVQEGRAEEAERHDRGAAARAAG